jgi:hypothetical protein
MFQIMNNQRAGNVNRGGRGRNEVGGREEENVGRGGRGHSEGGGRGGAH